MTSAADAKQLLFQNSLGDVVRSLRNSKKSESETIQEALADIKSEMQSQHQHVKVTAVMKLTYFHMLGYNGEHGAFHIIEVMADPIFSNKRTGYIAAATTFDTNTPVLPLCTALLKRDMLSGNQYEVGLALYFLSCVCNVDLARDLVADVVSLLTHSRSIVRKKAVLCLYKIFLQFPDALRLTYPRLKEKIEDGTDKSDTDPGVRGAVVTILCELARRNPVNFLNLVVPFFSLLSTVHNNWTLIKIVKVFGYFAPHEARLGKKLVDPISNLINTTHAKSVQYECIFAVANGMSKVPALTKTAVDKMKLFVEDRDQNLKYLGLDAMSRLMKENPKLLTDQRDTLLICLKDTDSSIRGKALELLSGIATRKTLVDTINAMFDNVTLSPPDEDWSNTVVRTIIETASFDDYAHVQDFEWYTAVLVDIAQLSISTFKHGDLVERELVNIALRVPAVRAFVVDNAATLLNASVLLNAADPTKSNQWRILCAAAFLVGELPQWLPNKKATILHLLQERLTLHPAELQGITVMSAGKIRDFLIRPLDRHTQRLAGEEDNVEPADPTTVADVAQYFLTEVPAPSTEKDRRLGIKGGLHLFLRSPHPDVTERAMVVAHLAGLTEPVDHQFFRDEMEPVVDDAQKHIPVPEGLDLDTPFCDVLPSLIKESGGEDDTDTDEDDSDDDVRVARLQNLERERRTKMDDYYIKTKDGFAGSPGRGADDDLPPVVDLDAVLPGTRTTARSRVAQKSHTMTRGLAKPATYVAAAAKGRSHSPDERDEAAIIIGRVNISEPVGKDEVLPTIKPYVRVDPTAQAAATDAAQGEATALETKRLAATRHFQQVEFGSDSNVACSLQVLECKARKDDSFALSVLVTVANASTGSHAVSDAKVLVDGTTVVFVDADGNPKESLAINARIKPGAQASIEATLVFTALPESFATPLALSASYVFSKKERSLAGSLPLLSKYFMKDTASASPADFNSDILPGLASAGCLSASIGLPAKFDCQAFVKGAEAQLRLKVVDTFRDCVSLYGQTVTRKSMLAQSHVAVVLVEEAAEDGASRQLTVFAKGFSGAHLEGIINELSQLVV